MNNPIHAFEANNYLLGHAWESAPVQALIEGWKQLEWLDQEALKKARTDHRLSLMNPALGLYLFFTDAESYEARYGQPCSRGSLILSRVSLMVNFNSQWSPYAGILPLSLRADDMAGDVLQQLGSPAEMWRVGLKVAKARWSLERAEVDASFEPGTGRLRLVTMTPPRVQPVLAAAVPSPEQFARQFGRPLAELQGEAQFDIFSLGRKAREIAEYGEADYSDQLGIELYFKPGAEMSDFIPTAARSSQPCLSGVRYRADLDFQSSGYAGALPWGLQMSDTLHVVAAKVAVQPLKEVLDDDDGYQLWRTDLCDVHVLHSFLEDRIYRVTLLARGCYE